MSTPQKELGHVQIATGKPDNDVLSALGSAQLSGIEYQIVIYIIRKTWGFNEKRGWIALQQFVDFTGRTEAGVYKAIRELKRKQIIHTERVENKPTIYSFNKDFKNWEGVYYSAGVNKSAGVQLSKKGGAKMDSKGVHENAPTKETITKETITKEILPKGNNGKAGEAPELKKRKDIDEIINTMMSVLSLPALDRSVKMNRFAAKRLIDKMVKLCEGDHAKAMRNILGVIQVASSDPFWGGKLTSVISLERNFLQIMKSSVLNQQAKSSSHISL